MKPKYILQGIVCLIIIVFSVIVLLDVFTVRQAAGIIAFSLSLTLWLDARIGHLAENGRLGKE